jgi:hypothetical protein
MTTPTLYVPFTLTSVKVFVLGWRVVERHPAVFHQVSQVVAMFLGDPAALRLHGRVCSFAEMTSSLPHEYLLAWLVLAYFGDGPVHAKCTQRSHPRDVQRYTVFCPHWCRFWRNRGSGTRCANCRQLGCYHRDCPMPPDLDNRRELKCAHCHGVGHLAGELYCPKHEEHDSFTVLMRETMGHE